MLCRTAFTTIMVGALFITSSCNLSGDSGLFQTAGITAEVTNILFSTNPRATHVVLDVEVTPGGATRPDTAYYVSLMSRDGYLFDLQTQALKWTEEKLQVPGPEERNYNVIRQAEERKIKRFELGAPLSDKAIVALNNDSKSEAEKLAEKYAREIQGALQAGDLVEVFKLAGKDPELSKTDINRIFNRHLKLVVTDKAGLVKRYNQKVWK